MRKHYVISWRIPGGGVYFFRGDSRYEIFLPYVSAERVSQGWTRQVEYARVFEAFPALDRHSFAKNFDAERLRIFPYEGEVLQTQVLRPTRRSPKRLPPG